MKGSSSLEAKEEGAGAGNRGDDLRISIQSGGALYFNHGSMIDDPLRLSDFAGPRKEAAYTAIQGARNSVRKQKYKLARGGKSLVTE